MRKVSRAKNDQQAQRFEALQQELAAQIARVVPDDGQVEVRPGLHLYRHAHPVGPVHATPEPSLCVIAQGSKVLTLGDERFRYDPANYLISTMELPLTAQIIEATPDQPYLGLRLVFDTAVVASVMVESSISPPRGDGGGVKAIDVNRLDADLLDAILRLVRYADNASEYRVLGPLVVREIIYRLLTGAQGDRMYHLATFGGHAHRMVRAVQKLREQFDKPLRIESVARELGMSVSGFHAHFKAVTSMSPLQFQKRLRLHEARRLMLSENLDAAQAGFEVGYDDASHFSREYKRQFGEPPIRDIARLREVAAAG
ncbi:MAG: helix-turn-helix domain-containing protein [Phycisphaera sp.]|nr:helix-turn-helix domain-containing protein [Phycisphaera sp.]